MSFNFFNNDSENSNYDNLLKKLTETLYSWHDDISSEIDNNPYVKEIDELMIDIKVYTDFILSALIYQEMICESSGISYVKEVEAKYSLLDIFKIINSLINKDESIKKKDLMIFSVLLFKGLKGEKISINLNQITNKIHPIISMIFYNELQKQIRDLGLKKITDKQLKKNNFVIENFASLIERKIKEDFIFRK